MPRLDTQVNQIYLVGPETKKISIVLYDEKITSRIHLFLLADLRDIQKKTETQNLKKISEIVLTAFRDNKKLTADTLFESALAQINESLADIAHRGRKSWLGKFSCGIMVKSSDQIFLANTGQISAWLRRDSELMELLAADANGDHPLKTFQNFTQGKLQDNDDLILTGNSMFNFVSLELFKRTLHDLPIDQACLKISKILQDSVGPNEGVGAFMLNVGSNGTTLSEVNSEEEIYAPLAENIEQPSQGPKVSGLGFSLSGVQKILRAFLSKAKKIGGLIKPPKLYSLKSLSSSAKFFLSSFLVFLVLLGLSLTVSAIRSSNSKKAEKIEAQVTVLVTSINATESALIYKNQTQAFDHLRVSQEELEVLQEIDEQAAQIYQEIIDDLYNKVNRISTVENPEILVTFDQAPDLLSRAGPGFVFINSSTQLVQNYNTELSSLFTLNNTSGDIRGLTHIEGLGNYLITQTELYRINGALSQFDKVRDFPETDLWSLKFLSPNRAYTLDKNQDQVVRINFNSNGATSVESALTTVVQLESAVDLAVGSDIYVLFPDRISKFSRGIEQSFELSTLTDTLTKANKIFVGSNLYVLEAEKKRLIIYDLQGNLVNQIYFPNSENLKDLHVDEPERTIYVLDNDKFLKITY